MFHLDSIGQKEYLLNDINYHLEQVVLCGAIVSNFLELFLTNQVSNQSSISTVHQRDLVITVRLSIHFAILSRFFLRREAKVSLQFLYFEE